MTSKPLGSFFVAGAIVAALFSGCQTAPKVQSEFDKAAPFAAAKTFAVRPLPKQIPGVDPGMVLRVGPAAMDAVRASMKEKGFTEVSDVATADLAVLVHGKVVPKTEITDWGFTPYVGRAGWYRGYPYGVYGGTNVTVDQYNEGTLIVEVYDIKTKKMIWVGWVTATPSEDKSKQKGQVVAGVAQILAEYPAVGTIPVEIVEK
jgi:hypothetical protein